jgi:branched-subunit amino acid aminotransferase/4-amino-4-deoxychorismate lyase
MAAQPPLPPSHGRPTDAQTILVSPATSIFLEARHHTRLARAAHALGFACATQAEVRARVLEAVGADLACAHRVRLVAERDGSLHVTATRLPLPHGAFPAADPAAAPLPVVLDRVRVDTSRLDLSLKTTARQLYDDARLRVGCAPMGAPSDGGPFDALLVNEAGELTEAGIANVAVELAPGRPWRTPPLRCGLVDGVMRRELLERGQLVEGVITTDELSEVAARRVDAALGEWAPRIYCFNAVRGVYEVALVSGASVAGVAGAR